MVPSQTTPLSPFLMRPTASYKKGPFPLAVFVEGQFPNAYAAERPNEILTPKPGKLILVGATTMFQEQLLRKGGHLNFILNSMDAVSLGEDLMQIRSKQPIDRSIKRVSAAGKVWWKFFASLLIPILITIIGGMRIFLRKQIKDNYLKLVRVVS